MKTALRDYEPTTWITRARTPPEVLRLSSTSVKVKVVGSMNKTASRRKLS